MVNYLIFDGDFRDVLRMSQYASPRKGCFDRLTDVVADQIAEAVSQFQTGVQKGGQSTTAGFVAVAEMASATMYDAIQHRSPFVKSLSGACMAGIKLFGEFSFAMVDFAGRVAEKIPNGPVATGARAAEIVIGGFADGVAHIATEGYHIAQGCLSGQDSYYASKQVTELIGEALLLALSAKGLVKGGGKLGGAFKIDFTHAMPSPATALVASVSVDAGMASSGFLDVGLGAMMAANADKAVKAVQSVQDAHGCLDLEVVVVENNPRLTAAIQKVFDALGHKVTVALCRKTDGRALPADVGLADAKTRVEVVLKEMGYDKLEVIFVEPPGNLLTAVQEVLSLFGGNEGIALRRRPAPVAAETPAPLVMTEAAKTKTPVEIPPAPPVLETGKLVTKSEHALVNFRFAVARQWGLNPFSPIRKIDDALGLVSGSRALRIRVTEVAENRIVIEVPVRTTIQNVRSFRQIVIERVATGEISVSSSQVVARPLAPRKSPAYVERKQGRWSENHVVHLRRRNSGLVPRAPTSDGAFAISARRFHQHGWGLNWNTAGTRSSRVREGSSNFLARSKATSQDGPPLPESQPQRSHSESAIIAKPDAAPPVVRSPSIPFSMPVSDSIAPNSVSGGRRFGRTHALPGGKAVPRWKYDESYPVLHRREFVQRLTSHWSISANQVLHLLPKGARRLRILEVGENYCIIQVRGRSYRLERVTGYRVDIETHEIVSRGHTIRVTPVGKSR